MNINHIIGKKVDEYTESQQDETRDYLGISKIGCALKCEREAWFRANGKKTKSLSAKTLRIFRMGDVVEELLVKDLKEAGYTVTDEQKEVVATQGDKKLVGHIDGIITIDGEQCLLEIKSCNQSKFNRCVKVGYEEWNQEYKVQAHAYALLLGLKKIVVAVECKNDSKRYFETFQADYKFATESLQLPFKIWSGRKPLGVCKSKKQFSYLWCDFNGECL